VKWRRWQALRAGLKDGGASFAVSAVLMLLAHPGPVTSVWRLFGGRPLEAFSTDRLLSLAGAHAELAVLAIVPAAIAGIGLGVLVTRPFGTALRPLTDTVVAGSQAVPPVVVVALAFPSLGFGAAPTVLALILYGIMPILRSTVAALESIPTHVTAAAQAMGLTPGQVFRDVEWPLAFPVILQGVRVALVLAVATAAVGALAGATTLGTPIVIGLQNQNELYVLQGAAATAALAFIAEGLLASLAGQFRTRQGSISSD
jgi:osmoprotectant transport system permease protein